MSTRSRTHLAAPDWKKIHMPHTLSSEKLSERALERRIKRQLKKKVLNFFAICPPAFVPLLGEELAALGISTRHKLEGGVHFSAELDAIYHTNLHLRSAHRVLLRLKENFLAQSYAMLFDHAKRIPWEVYCGFHDKVKISVTAKASKLNFQQPLIETLHNAMLERLRPLKLEPALHNDNDEDTGIEIMARIYQDRCTLSLNTTGTHLHKRGYRQHVGDAPLRETLAASVILWLEKELATRNMTLEHFQTILDPFCGSGTLLIEAAQRLQGYPAGSQRSFAFEALPFFQASKWQRLQREALAEVRPLQVELIGRDRDAKVLHAASHNSRDVAAIHYQHMDALEANYPEGKTLILSNPPYGARLGTRHDVEIMLRKWLEQLPTHYHICVIVPAWLELAPQASSIHFRNGNVAVKALYIAPS